ncbi:hypothetical protein ACFXDE_21085 [Kitasatospora sp. NPDC059408]|uniref:hypothetical protein n=1 Tax=Kitasatospora sp. NPDC059408 TaxID=3346823 RepID=UPI0036BFD608
MAEGKQRLETKQITGQVITHTIVKPIEGDYLDGNELDGQRLAALKQKDTTSE